MKRKEITYLKGPRKGETLEKSEGVAKLFVKRGLAKWPDKKKKVEEKEEKDPAETKEDKTVTGAKTKGKK